MLVLQLSCYVQCIMCLRQSVYCKACSAVNHALAMDEYPQMRLHCSNVVADSLSRHVCSCALPQPHLGLHPSPSHVQGGHCSHDVYDLGTPQDAHLHASLGVNTAAGLV